jgi:hypothetical protein
MFPSQLGLFTDYSSIYMGNPIHLSTADLVSGTGIRDLVKIILNESCESSLFLFRKLLIKHNTKEIKHEKR